jgi:hypothetical protein
MHHHIVLHFLNFASASNMYVVVAAPGRRAIAGARRGSPRDAVGTAGEEERCYSRMARYERRVMQLSRHGRVR